MLTDKQKEIFIRDGFIFLQNAVPKELIDQALAKADEFHAAGAYTFDEAAWDPVLRFNHDAQHHPDVGRLLRKSYFLQAALRSLLGEGNVRHGDHAQIAYRPFDAGAHKRGVRLDSTTNRKAYHIDGGDGPYRHNATSFTALLGVCLSEGQDVNENRGQLMVWPGSHFALHERVRERWAAGEIDRYNVLGGQDVKPDLGPGVRVLMRPGDAVIVHQRLAHSGGINVCEQMRKNLYFRISHMKHEDMIEDVIKGHVMTQFEGVHHLL